MPHSGQLGLLKNLRKSTTVAWRYQTVVASSDVLYYFICTCKILWYQWILLCASHIGCFFLHSFLYKFDWRFYSYFSLKSRMLNSSFHIINISRTSPGTARASCRGSSGGERSWEGKQGCNWYQRALSGAICAYGFSFFDASLLLHVSLVYAGIGYPFLHRRVWGKYMESCCVEWPWSYPFLLPPLIRIWFQFNSCCQCLEHIS